MASIARQTGGAAIGTRILAHVETWLEAERAQLPLWVPVAVTGGIAAWWALPGTAAWTAFCCLAAAVAAVALGFGRGGRAARAIGIAASCALVGCALVWLRADLAAAPRLDRPLVARFAATVERVETLAARNAVRLTLAPLGRIGDRQSDAGNTRHPGESRDPEPRAMPPFTLDPGLRRDDCRVPPRTPLSECLPSPVRRARPQERSDAPGLPPRVRVTVDADKAPATLATGATVAVRARLAPPPEAAVPGAYDYAAVAWFRGIGAVGKALDPVRVIAAPQGRGAAAWLADARARLTAHILSRLPPGPAGVAAALATGDVGAVRTGDADAMRRAGLAHLLSVSGLHLTAVVGAAMIVTLRLLAASRTLALRLPLPLVAAGAGAVAGIAYTLLTGAEVPTVRSLVAALIVLGGLALAREAVTLRMVAAGAMVVLLAWPEQAAGASFELSFAAIVAIVALHEAGWAHRLFAPREEAWGRRMLRSLGGLLATGIAVEVALMPIAVYHFHRTGFYGAGANLVAIPLTTFVAMPAEGAALLLDLAGLGAPAWWVTGASLDLLLWLAHRVAALPGAVALVPTMGRGAFAAMVAGGLWLALWRTRVRLLGLVGLAAGIVATLAASPPDILVTGDGRHVAVRGVDGATALLRERTGDYVRDALSELGGREGDDAIAFEGLPGAACTRDLCAATLDRGGRRWRLLATRSADLVPAPAFRRRCAVADIVVSDRRLPDWCRPRWLRADRTLLARTGGLAIRLAHPTIATVAATRMGKPWAEPSGNAAPPQE